jgi:hypothetical protein
MTRLALACVAALFCVAGLGAHHSYGLYDQEHAVLLTGEIAALRFSAPHPMITLQTGENQRYEVEWSTLGRLAYDGVSRATLKPGDRIEVIGFVMRDPSQRRMSLVRMVRRTTDGWQWGEAVPVVRFGRAPLR